MRQLVLFCLAFATSMGLFATDFDILMGKETKHWKHLVQKEDQQLLGRFKSIYDSHFQALVTKQEGNTIPKVIHFIWIGPAAFPAESVENVRMWMQHHPDWTVKFWTDRKRHLPCKGMEEVFVEDFSFALLEKEYHQSTNWGEKSDILRYEILLAEGGIYTDHDANCLTSFENLNAGFDFYAGLEAPHPPLAGQYITCGNGVIGARADHPVIRQALQNIGERWDDVGSHFLGEDGFNRTERVLNRTYTALTQAVKAKIGEGENRDIVLPAAYFFAKAGIKSLYSQHFYANRWADEGGKTSFHAQGKAFNKVEQKLKTMQTIVMTLLILHLFMIIAVTKKRKTHEKT